MMHNKVPQNVTIKHKEPDEIKFPQKSSQTALIPEIRGIPLASSLCLSNCSFASSFTKSYWRTQCHMKMLETKVQGTSTTRVQWMVVLEESFSTLPVE